MQRAEAYARALENIQNHKVNHVRNLGTIDTAAVAAAQASGGMFSHITAPVDPSLIAPVGDPAGSPVRGSAATTYSMPIMASAAHTRAPASVAPVPAPVPDSNAPSGTPKHGGGSGGGGSGPGGSGHGGSGGGGGSHGPTDGGPHDGGSHGPSDGGPSGPSGPGPADSGDHAKDKQDKTKEDPEAPADHAADGDKEPEPFIPKLETNTTPPNPKDDAKDEKKKQKLKDQIDKNTDMPSQSELRQLWVDTNFLTVQDMWHLGKHIWEYWVRTRVRLMKGRFSKFDANLPFIGTEMLRIKEETEHHEVGQFKEAMTNMGIIEVRGLLNRSSNADQIKACIEVLTEKGQMRWDDVRTWDAINRISYLPGDKKIPIPRDRDPYSPVGMDEETVCQKWVWSTWERRLTASGR